MIKKNVGVLLPVSALPGDHGIGDFSNYAYQFIDWLKEHHYHYWQILPLNPLGPGDSPYVNIVAVKKGKENDPAIQALVKALKSDKVKNWIKAKYPNGDVVAVF